MSSRRLIVVALLAMAVLAGCERGAKTTVEPVVPIRNMFDQPRYDPQQASVFFKDGRTMRPLADGVVAREMEPELTLTTGRTADNADWLITTPTEIVERFGDRRAMIERGQERYNIYCAPCHGLSGDSGGMVALRAAAIGAPALTPPNLHDARLKQIPDGQLYATITNGIRNMPAYRHNIPLNDRWAIVSYVRALQVTGIKTASKESKP